MYCSLATLVIPSNCSGKSVYIPSPSPFSGRLGLDQTLEHVKAIAVRQQIDPFPLAQATAEYLPTIPIDINAHGPKQAVVRGDGNNFDLLWQLRGGYCSTSNSDHLISVVVLWR